MNFVTLIPDLDHASVGNIRFTTVKRSAFADMTGEGAFLHPRPARRTQYNETEEQV